MTDTTHGAPKVATKVMDRLTEIDQLRLHVLNDLSEPCLVSLLDEVEKLEAERDEAKASHAITQQREVDANRSAFTYLRRAQVAEAQRDALAEKLAKIKRSAVTVLVIGDRDNGPGRFTFSDPDEAQAFSDALRKSGMYQVTDHLEYATSTAESAMQIVFAAQETPHD